MKARQALIDQWQLMEKHGIKPSARKCIALVRLMGIKVRNEEGFACLEKFRGALWERSKSDTGSSKGIEKQAQREHFEVLPKENAGSVPSAPSRVNKELLVTKLSTSPPYPSDTTEPLDGETPPERSAEKPKRQRTEREREFYAKSIALPQIDDPRQPDWVVRMRTAASELSGRKLCELSVSERFTLARYHAWRWGNCTKDEVRNRKRATEIAAGITNLALHKIYALMTPDDYIEKADVVWSERGGTPWYKPWDITARFEEIECGKSYQNR